jgi:hypothetical protein
MTQLESGCSNFGRKSRVAGWKRIRSGANGEKGTVLSANMLDNRRKCRHNHMLDAKP